MSRNIMVWGLGLGLWVIGKDAACQVADSVGIEEVVVVAAGSGNNMASVAPAHSVRGVGLLRLGAGDVADVLRRMPGVTVKDYGGAGGMKTVSVRGFGSQHTGVTYDGIAVSDCQTGEIDLQRYTLSGVTEVRLAIGDGNDIFQPARNTGSAATLSLISTEKPEKPEKPASPATPAIPAIPENPATPENPENPELPELPELPVTPPSAPSALTPPSALRAGLGLGAWGYANPVVRVWQRLSGGVTVGGLVDFVHADNDYPFTLENGRLRTSLDRSNSRMDQWHGEVDVVAAGGAARRWELRGKAYYYDNDRQLPGAVHYYVNDNDETLHERNAFGQMQLRAMVSDRVSVKVSGKWNWASSAYHNGKPSGGITSNEYWQREGYVSAVALYVPTERLSMSYAADYFVNSLNSTSQDIRPKRHSVLQALSVRYRDDRLTVVARGWCCWVREETEDRFRVCPSVSAGYRLTRDQDWRVRVSWKEMIRMPSFREMYYFHLGDPELSPEKTRQWNIGLTHSSRSGRVEADGSIDVYINKVEDKIVTIPLNMFVSRSVNMSEVMCLGTDVSLSGKYRLSRRHALGLMGSYSYQQVENHTDSGSPYYGNQIAYTPSHSGSVTAYWENPWACLSVTGDGMSERWTTNEHSEGTRIAGFMEWTVSAYRQFGNVTVKASVTNILDRQYDLVARYPMPGRGWKVGLEWNL
ncbi:MAG: TonB-dependent receptor [Bacteroidaceae bacterium]|nr:TonB-dependent receptor [Bacteroidaceae bacterium]